MEKLPNSLKKRDRKKQKEELLNNFDNWMRNIVKNVHYSNNDKMCKAYKKLELC